MKHLSLLSVLLCLSAFCIGQPTQPITWGFKVNYISARECVLTFTALIRPGWHLYSQFMAEGGPMPTHFSFESTGNYDTVGKVQEVGKPIKFHDENLEMDIIWYSDSVVFSQRIRLYQHPIYVKSKVEFMACNGQVCLPIEEQQFTIEITPWKKSP